MALHYPKRVVVGLMLIAVGVGILIYSPRSTRLVSDVSLEREPPPNEVSVGFGPEVEEWVTRFDLRIPAALGLLGTGVIASGFVRRQR